MPNKDRTVVHLREILESPQFSQSESPLTLPLGRDVSGEAITAALDDMPHLLIAGATGSGKSVCMNTFLTALLYQKTLVCRMLSTLLQLMILAILAEA